MTNRSGGNILVIMSSSKHSLDNKTQAWSARFSEPVSELVQRYTASINFDYRLAEVDIQSSLVHAQMLSEQGIISPTDFAQINSGLQQILQEIQQGHFTWQLNLEDVHLNIEARLTSLIGDAGKRLHTARSRNDQVATDIRLWLRNAIDEILSQLTTLRRSFCDLAEKHAHTIMPGFTHLQVAQPITVGHHLMAYVEMLHRDATRFQDCRVRLNQLPLGSAALAGTSYPINRDRVAQVLGFDGVCQNSLDAVSDRDFAIEFCAASAIVMTHISRFSEELILWMSPQFGFVNLPDRFCTGSSIMPQKKNPDVPELARGKTGRVNGNLISLLTLMKGQVLAYNKDNQEDKEPLFDSASTVIDTLRIFADLVVHLEFKEANLLAAVKQGFATATDLADYLVKKGMPFRDAHEAVANAVKVCASKGVDLAELNLTELRLACALSNPDMIGSDITAVLTLQGSVNSRNHVGGTAPERVLAAITQARSLLKD